MAKRYIMTSGFCRPTPSINGIISIAIAAFAFSSGCGSGGVPKEGAMITRANRSLYSDDAMILAARQATSPWIPADAAAAFDRDLRTIRSRYPVLTAVHARADYVRTDLLIAVSNTAPWLNNWKAGTANTGEARLDALLQEFDVDAVRDALLTTADRTWFRVEFAQPLSMDRLADRVRTASPNIPSVEPNAYAGDGDNIVNSSSAGGRVLTFSKGWGDCPSGCIYRHSWEVSIASSGDLSVREFGNPLP